MKIDYYKKIIKNIIFINMPTEKNDENDSMIGTGI